MHFKIRKTTVFYPCRGSYDLSCWYILGDTKERCSTFKVTRTRAAIIFVIGFWMLDLANNTVQGPARALLADLSGPEQRNSANAVFCSWMAVGNILGFSAGASGNWHRWFPFLTNRTCCEACGNLKAAFLVAVVFLTLCTLVTIYFANEVPLAAPEQPNCLSDSAPLLDDPTENGLELLKLKHDRPVVASAYLNNSENGYEQYITPKHGNSKVVNDQNENFGDGPGAVLVNLLTSVGICHLQCTQFLLFQLLVGCPGSPSFFLIQIGWEEKYTMEIQKGVFLK